MKTIKLKYMKKIIIIIPYFGKLPNLFKYWYKSAVNNKTIDFLIISDNDIPNAENILTLKMDFDRLKSIISSKIGSVISLENPYKLCDFKVAYGIIFSDYIKNYDFWGYGDIDLVYGDIRNFITEKILEKYDFISGWGHFTLCRNNSYCNNFYKIKIEGFQYYEDVFRNPKNFAFDEYLHKGLSDKWVFLHKDKVYQTVDFDDIRVPHNRYDFESIGKGLKNLIFEYSNKKLYRMYLDNNKVRKEESLYVHFQKRNIFKYNVNPDADNYIIIPNKFIPYKPINNRI